MLHLAVKLFRYIFSYLSLIGSTVGLLPKHLIGQYSDHTIDITIKLHREIQDAKLQLKISADIKEAKYETTRSTERIIRRISNEKM